MSPFLISQVFFPNSLEVYCAPIGNLQQLTNLLITFQHMPSSVSISKPNFGFGFIFFFWWLQSNKNQHVGDWIYEISSLSNKKKFPSYSVDSKVFLGLPWCSVVRNLPAKEETWDRPLVWEILTCFEDILWATTIRPIINEQEKITYFRMLPAQKELSLLTLFPKFFIS